MPNIRDDWKSYTAYIVYCTILWWFFPQAGFAALIRKLCIPVLIATKDLPRVFWSILSIAIIANLIVDSTLVTASVVTLGLHWLAGLPVIIGLSIVFVWTIDRLFIHKFQLIPEFLVLFYLLQEVSEIQPTIKSTEPLEEILMSDSVILYNN